MRVAVQDSRPALNIDDLWRSTDALAWEQALQGYWLFVQPRNLELERALDALDVAKLHELDARGWYDFLHDEYFRWKYTAPNRYATTTRQLKKYIDDAALAELDSIRQEILRLDVGEVYAGLRTAKKVRGLGTAGASGLLSLIYPAHFATVDQFVVKALRLVSGFPEAETLSKMEPQNLSISDGAILIGVLSRKARDNNRVFGVSTWTPRKIDMVLWTYGR